MMKRKPAVKVAEYGCMLALAMIISYIEAILPVSLGIPGAKLGLANFIVVLCLYGYGKTAAAVINISRVILCGILFGSLYSMQYALAGAVFSLIVMMLCSKIKVFGMVGVSILGGVAHNLAQFIVATFISQAPVILFYVPFLVVIGGITGCANGILANIIYKRVPIFANLKEEKRNTEKE